MDWFGPRTSRGCSRALQFGTRTSRICRRIFRQGHRTSRSRFRRVRLGKRQIRFGILFFILLLRLHPDNGFVVRGIPSLTLISWVFAALQAGEPQSSGTQLPIQVRRILNLAHIGQ